MSITAEGCPSAAARLISRPSPRRYTLLPFLRVYSSTKSLIVLLDFDIFLRASIAISTLKCPELQKMAPSFIRLKHSLYMTSISPVAVTNMSPIRAASLMGITSNPSIVASSPRRGLTSVIIIFAPMPFALIAMPLLHHP